MNITVVDFDDSFTFNIVSYLEKIFTDVKLVHWEELENIKSHSVMLGPGPGSPEDYLKNRKFEANLKSLVSSDRLLGGLCLGHQLLGLMCGFKLKKLESPVHGVPLKVELPSWSYFGKHSKKEVFVQRYNSLCLQEKNKSLSENVWLEKNSDNILGFYKDNILSFQFHPESVGTDHSGLFFYTFSQFYKGF